MQTYLLGIIAEILLYEKHDCIEDHPFSTQAKFSKKSNIFHPLMVTRTCGYHVRTCTCAYQGVRNVIF